MRDFVCSKELALKLTDMAKRMRLNGLEMAFSTGNKGAHSGGGFSCMEILAVLYGTVLSLDPKNPTDPNRDRFLPSKNHCTLAHFPALYEAGFIPKDEISYDPTVTAQDVLKVGDEVELLIMKTNDQEGTIMLSKKRVDAQKNWEELEALNGSDEIFTGKVIEAVNGGIIVMLKDNRI